MKQNIPLYTPSLIDAETLKSIFVKRQPLLDDVFARHKNSILTQSKHFTLLVGPRGMGKTHLISMLYHMFSTDKNIKNKVLISWLREEEWGIASYLDLLTQIITALTSEYSLEGISTKLNSLLSLGTQEAEYQAEKILLELLQNKTLLLLVENLNIIFDSLEKEGQEKLRALIQNTGKITIIAASQSLFSGVSLRSCPFYGFFNITHLEKLSFDEALELLTNIAEYENKQDLVEILKTEKGRVRVRALHHLAGGSPRIYVIFSQFIQADSLDEFTHPMLKMLDELTPYYQAKMLELSAQQRKLVTFLCRAKGAVTVQGIAHKNHITQQTASGQLKKLKESGFVESQKLGKESYYEIAEPLMRLVFSLKENRGTPASIIIELIRHWFSLDELKQYQDDESLTIFGKKFVGKDLIQRAMEIKEPSPHLSSTMAEFSRCLERGEGEKAKTVLLDLVSFSKDLEGSLDSELANYAFEEQDKIRGKNLSKRLSKYRQWTMAIPEEFRHGARLFFLTFCHAKLDLKEEEITYLIKCIVDIKEYENTISLVVTICAKNQISFSNVDHLCRDLNLSTEIVFGLMWGDSAKYNAKPQLKNFITRVKDSVEFCDFFTVAFSACTNQLIKDTLLFTQIAKHNVISDEEILALAASFTALNKTISLQALIDTHLESLKNDSIYDVIMNLKKFSDSKDKKQLMTLPKEVRELILLKQTELNNDKNSLTRS